MFLKNLENREEKENFNIKNLKKREEKENFPPKILKIERRTRHENSLLQLERENYESFLFENFSRSRLLSMTDSTLGLYNMYAIVILCFHEIG